MIFAFDIQVKICGISPTFCRVLYNILCAWKIKEREKKKRSLMFNAF